MLDQLFIEQAPEWINMMYESILKEVTLDLRENSDFYMKMQKKISGIYEEYPEFARIIENEEEQKEVSLSKESAKKLAELIRAELEVMEIYQRMIYLRGWRAGILCAKYVGLAKDKI